MRSSPSRFQTGREEPDVELARMYNDAAIALNLLYAAADSGSGAAREKLRELSNELIEAAGRYSGVPEKRVG